MATKITATELARNLSEILNRIRYTGERFVVQRNGETVATLAPAPPQSTLMWREFAERLETLPKPDEAFADDLEALQSEQQTVNIPE